MEGKRATFTNTAPSGWHPSRDFYSKTRKQNKTSHGFLSVRLVVILFDQRHAFFRRTLIGLLFLHREVVLLVVVRVLGRFQSTPAIVRLRLFVIRVDWACVIAAFVGIFDRRNRDGILVLFLVALEVTARHAPTARINNLPQPINDDISLDQ